MASSAEIYNFILQRCKEFGITQNDLKRCVNTIGKTKKMKEEDVLRSLKTQLDAIEKDCVISQNVVLKDYQLKIVRHMLTHRGVVISFDVGKGKTLTAVTIINCLLRQASVFSKRVKTYIITPTSLQDNFKKEMTKFGMKTKGLDIEYYTIVGFVNAYKKGEIQCKDSLMIIDEAHNLRTDYRNEFSAISFGAQDVEDKRAYNFVQCAMEAWKVVLLTATPIYNMSHDIVNLVSMVKGVSPLTAYEYYKLMEDENEDAFKEYFKDVFAFEKTRTDDFPKRKDEYVYIKMTNEYYKEYMEKENVVYHRVMKKATNQNDENMKNSFMIKMRKATNNMSPCLKCDKIMSILENGKKTIIYSEFIDSGIEIVRNRLDAKGIKYLFITGKVNKKKRSEIVEQMNTDPTFQVLFITKAGGEGLDLKRIRQVILMEKGWTVESEEQVIGRAVRFRSHADLPVDERTVTVYHLVMVKPEDIGLISNYTKFSAPVSIMSPPSKEHIISADLYMMKKSRAKNEENKKVMAKLYKYQVGAN